MTSPDGLERPAQQAGQIPTEHGLEAVPSERRRPLVAPLLGGAIVLAILGWIVFGPTADAPQPSSSEVAPIGQPPGAYRAPAGPQQ